MAEMTTLKLGGRARALARVEVLSDLEELPGLMRREGGRPVVLGRGSNILAHDGNLDVVLVVASVPSAPLELGRDGDKVAVRAGAGLTLPAFLGWLKKRGLSGLEGLAGIPGTVGGAVAMNAGSFGVSFCDAAYRVRVWTPKHGLKWLDRTRWTCGYRSFAPRLRSDFFLILEVEAELTASTPEKVGDALARTYAEKKRTQPVLAHTAGCVFKNPEGADPAGRLLEMAGFRGKKLGQMAFSEKHANFLVNLGGGSADQALELIEQARAGVAGKFGVHLELEVEVI